MGRGELVLHTSWRLFHVTLPPPPLVFYLPPPMLRHAVVPVLSPLQHTPTANRKLLEGHREQNDRSSRTGPPDAEGSL